MKHYQTSNRKGRTRNQKVVAAHENAGQLPILLDEGAMDYSTIDGDVITRTDGTDAISKGKGMFIGDYFVGILDSLSGWNTAPLLRY